MAISLQIFCECEFESWVRLYWKDFSRYSSVLNRTHGPNSTHGSGLWKKHTPKKYSWLWFATLVLEDIMVELFDEYIRLTLASIFAEDP